MSSGRSGAPGEGGESEPTLVPWANLPPAPSQASPRRTTSGGPGGARSGASGGASANSEAGGGPLGDLPALPNESLPRLGRLPYDASERGKFWPGLGPRSAPAPALAPAHQDAGPDDPFLARISGLAAAQLFAPPPPRQPTAASADAPTPISQTTDAALAAVGAVGAPQAGDGVAHAPTLTQQMRTVQPPDVARQALNELNVLADEIIKLAAELEASGLARIHAGAFYAVARHYGELARLAWLSVAAERLEQDGADSEYRHLAIGVAREVTRLRRESDVAASNEQFPLPRRHPYLWSVRAGAIVRGLRGWQLALTTPADPQWMGLALFELRGALSVAATPPLDYSLLAALTGVALTLTPLSGLAAGLAAIASALGGQPVMAASFALVTVLALMLWAILLLLTSRGRITLSETLAGACFSDTRSTCNGRAGSQFIAVALRAWWLLVGVVGSALTLGALGVSGYALARLPRFAPLLGGAPQSAAAGVWQAAGLLAVVAAPAAAVATVALLVAALPALLVAALRLAAEMAGSRRWAPAARRYTLVPALATLAWLTGALAPLAWLLANRLGLEQWAVEIGAGGVGFILSGRAILVALALLLPYLALVEAPFRLGLGGWRRAWLRDLRTRRTTIEAHVRRLSAPDPRTGVPDTSDETLRAMQYDLVLLQFYSARISEAERASASPLGLGGSVALLIIVALGAALLDAGPHALTLAQALSIRLTP
ncbi:MAG: hypothetical protein KGO05_05250 [Chloroflexota bacterium]|nr:hypothetical protein [Chloroflexota bacterium]